MFYHFLASHDLRQFVYYNVKEASPFQFILQQTILKKFRSVGANFKGFMQAVDK